VSGPSNREVIERYIQAIVDRDFDEQDRLRHPGYVSEYPQSGERIRGPANARAILDNYPGGLGKVERGMVVGSEDRWVPTPAGTLLRVTGAGDVYTGLFTIGYPGQDRPWHVAVVVEVRDAKVFRETAIFGEPFDPPAWRAEWVERM
jgi:hypothetical protein